MADHTYVVEERHEDGVLVLRLDRPPAQAFTTELLADLDAAVHRCAEDSRVRCVVVTGTGRFFSGGFDMKAPPRGQADALEMSARYHSAHRALVALAKPTLAALNGHTVAGGLILALACDQRVAVGDRFRIGLTEVAVGAGYPPAASAIAHDRLGVRAPDLVLGAELLWSDDPRIAFLVRQTFTSQFDEQVLALARELARFPATAYAHAKAELVRDLLIRIDSATDADRAAALAVWTDPESDAARERLRAALARTETT
jgi:enoyl-CoA hydratase/carnithine racemase